MSNRNAFEFIRQYRYYVAFCLIYLLGLIAAVLYINQYPYASLMRLLVYPQMSIVFGFMITAIPFVVLYIVLRCSAFVLIFPLAFFRAFTFMYCFAGISYAYAEAGWLVRALLLFSDFFSVPLLLWYAARQLLGNYRGADREIWFCLLFLFAVRCIDSFVVSPFASELLSF